MELLFPGKVSRGPQNIWKFLFVSVWFRFWCSDCGWKVSSDIQKKLNKTCSKIVICSSCWIYISWKKSCLSSFDAAIDLWLLLLLWCPAYRLLALVQWHNIPFISYFNAPRCRHSYEFPRFREIFRQLTTLVSYTHEHWRTEIFTTKSLAESETVQEVSRTTRLENRSRTNFVPLVRTFANR